MRVLIVGVALLASISQVQAADFGPLRGSQIEVVGGVDWNGAYVGLHGGGTGLSGDFGNGTQSLIAHLLRNTQIEAQGQVSSWTTLGKADTRGTHFGGFAGYNAQFENVVIGIEGTYSRTDVTLQASDSMGRLIAYANGTDWADIRVDASSTMHLTDYGTLRVRGGWAYGNFLPYGFVGAALGRATVSRTVRVSGTETTALGGSVPIDVSATEATADDFAYGVAAGFGIEFAVFENLFVRAEYEYIKFGLFNDLNTYLQSARVGAGLKF